jgi:hypothetical protein
VRIGLIPEDRKEAAQIANLTPGDTDNPELFHLYTKGLEGYTPGGCPYKDKLHELSQGRPVQLWEGQRQAEKVA